MDDFRIELFIFPDGTTVEMMVFDHAEDRATTGPPTTSAGRPAAAGDGATPAPATTCAVDHAPGAAAVATATPADAHVCPVCGGDLVHPMDWQRTGESAWQIRLRCPECHTERDVTMGRAEVEQLNRELYHGTQALAREAQRVSRQNFEDETRRFIAALRSGAIQPIDF
jgi:hypothetical protein